MNDTFWPLGNSLLITASTVATAAVQVSTAQVYGFRVINSSTVDCYLAIGTSTVAAVQPSSAAPANGMIIPGTVVHAPAEYIKTPPNCWLSAISTIALSVAILNITPGMKL